MTTRHFDVAIIGAGSAAGSLVDHLAGSGLDIVVCESGRVGGECPFTACLPGTTMLHDVGTGRTWDEAVRREQGATLVRDRAVLAGPGRVSAGGTDYAVNDVVHRRRRCDRGRRPRCPRRYRPRLGGGRRRRT